MTNALDPSRRPADAAPRWSRNRDRFCGVFRGPGQNPAGLLCRTRRAVKRARIIFSKPSETESPSLTTTVTALKTSSSRTAPRGTPPRAAQDCRNSITRRPWRFTEVGKNAGFAMEGWGQGVCVGDYDNDGWPDLLVTYHRTNRFYLNLRNGTVRDVTAEARRPVEGIRYGSGCSFFDYDREGISTSSSSPTML